MLPAAVTEERPFGFDPTVPRSSLASLNVTPTYSPQELLYKYTPHCRACKEERHTNTDYADGAWHSQSCQGINK